MNRTSVECVCGTCFTDYTVWKHTKMTCEFKIKIQLMADYLYPFIAKKDTLSYLTTSYDCVYRQGRMTWQMKLLEALGI